MKPEKTKVMDKYLLPGISLSGPCLLEISVNSRRILAAFLASDFRLDGIGLFTVNKQINSILTTYIVKALIQIINMCTDLSSFKQDTEGVIEA